MDGSKESEEAYALCYECHDRAAVLETSPFPFHTEHVVDEMTSCATCHSAHGSVDNRALIRFGEETFVAGVGPSLATGRLEFVSDGPGGGSCYLTCHGVDHSPLGYGGTATAELDSLVPDALTTAPPGLDERSPRVRRRPVIRDPPR